MRAASPNVRNVNTIRADLRGSCYNDQDPVMLEDFADMDPEQLREIVKIGTGVRKNCYALDSIFGVYKTAVEKNRTPKDPMNPSHALTTAEKARIDSLMKRRDPSYVPPRSPVRAYPPGMRLDIRTSGNFYELRILQHNAVVKNLGFVPADIDVRHSGSADLTSDVLVANLFRLWEAHRFLKPRRRGDLAGQIHCCLWHAYKRKEYWATDKLRKFVNMAQEVARLLD